VAAGFPRLSSRHQALPADRSAFDRFSADAVRSLSAVREHAGKYGKPYYAPTLLCPSSEKPVVESAAGAVADDQLIGMLVDRARTGGLQLTGEGGLLQQLTKRVLEGALEGEITDHLGYDKHDAEGRRRWTMRWKPALQAFAITFEGRLIPANH
jgi:hypothetical protein